MTDTKARVAASIAEAKVKLDDALAELERVPSVDPATIGYVAHALNNYLAVTVVTIEMMQHTLRDYPNPEVRTWLEGILHVTDLMHHTIGKLLQASAPAHFPLKTELVNLAMLMDRACNHYAHLAQRKQISVIYRTIGDIPLVRADRVAVAVVADNLLSNAVKFSKPGATVQVQVMTEPGVVVCSVRDQGPGLSTADQARLYQKGVPLSAVPTAGEPSTGYGLAMAREFMDRMGGQLWCESEAGGARFSFRLPSHE
jgi:two-component system, sensor histidine kinase LadS